MTHNLETPALGVAPRELNSAPTQNLNTNTGPLFRAAEKEEPRSASVDEQINEAGSHPHRVFGCNKE